MMGDEELADDEDDVPESKNENVQGENSDQGKDISDLDAEATK